MSLTVTAVVLLAALLHATWNFLVKRNSDKLLGMTAMVFGHVPYALLVLLLVPLPKFEAWPYLLASAVAHAGYQIFLLNAYKIGDLSQVYPLARGVAPLLVTLVSFLVLGEVLSGSELLAVLMIGSGLITLAFLRQADGLFNRNAVLLSLATGVFIAAYSMLDGLGARVGLSAFGYYAVLSVINALVWWVYLAFKNPALPKQAIIWHGRFVLQAGGASFTAYSLVVWAFTQAPLALVTALRETSIIFAMLLGMILLRETIGVKKILAALLTLLGVIMLRVSQL